MRAVAEYVYGIALIPLAFLRPRRYSAWEGPAADAENLYRDFIAVGKDLRKTTQKELTYVHAYPARSRIQGR